VFFDEETSKIKGERSLSLVFLPAHFSLVGGCGDDVQDEGQTVFVGEARGSLLYDFVGVV
jgi:hypothetical protein